jgi:phage-related baseplate assembly protein
MPLAFLETAPNVIFDALKSHFENASGRTLYPAQVENLLLKTLAYADAERRIATQFCAEQGLVAYAVGEHLDALGDMLACARLQAAPAETRVKFTLAAPSLNGRVFPAGTKITTEDAKIVFQTTAPAYVISAKSESSEAPAVCTATGTAANGIPPGALCLLDPEQDGVTMTNLAPTEGGAATETDSAYRERLFLAPSTLGCGGTASGYRYWARTASPLVADAWPMQGIEGDINIYVLAQDGEPTDELLAKVQDTCNSPDVRLINDYIYTHKAIKREYTIKAEITVFDTHDPEAALDRVNALAHEYARKQRLKLGLNITPTQIILALSPEKEKLYHVNLIEPSKILEIPDNAFAEAIEIKITLAGVARG